MGIRMEPVQCVIDMGYEICCIQNHPPLIDEQPLTCVGPLDYLGSWDAHFVRVGKVARR